MISVVIPLYNKEKYILETLESVLSQTYEDFEVIIVDDGSMDSSLELAKSVNDSRIKIVKHSKNKGLSAARNTGITKSNGAVISLLDADDKWEPTYLKEVVKLFEDFPKASLYGVGYQEVYGVNDKRNIKISINKTQRNQRFYITDFFMSNLGMPIVCPSSFSFKKDIFKSIETFDESIDFAEDVDFYIRSNLMFQMAYSYRALVSVNMNVQGQMTSQPLGIKKLPDLQSFENENSNNMSLLKYLNFKRYMFAMKYKWNSNKKGVNFMLNSLDKTQLTFKQRVLIWLPYDFYWLVRHFKLLLLRVGVRWSTY